MTNQNIQQFASASVIHVIHVNIEVTSYHQRRRVGGQTFQQVVEFVEKRVRYATGTRSVQNNDDGVETSTMNVSSDYLERRACWQLKMSRVQRFAQ
jgi:hypothetical protein